MYIYSKISVGVEKRNSGFFAAICHFLTLTNMFLAYKAVIKSRHEGGKITET